MTSANKDKNSSLKTNNNNNDEDDEWLFESVVAFLNSPIWTIPIQHFIEKHCPIFSPNDGWSGGALLDENYYDEDEDDDDVNLEKVPTEYLDVHFKYKDLVDRLINAFLQDLGVSYNKFLRACKNSNRFTQHPIYIDLFEQIWSAENFKMFKSQMIRKNIELELQALVLLQYQLGLIKSNESNTSSSLMSEDEIMALVIKKSKDEYDSLMNNRSDLDVARKIAVKSDKLVETIKQDLEHQENISMKLVEETLKNEETRSTSRPGSARPVKNSFEKLSLSEKSSFNHEIKNKDDDDEDVVARPHSSRIASARAKADPQNSSTNLAQNYLNNGNISESELKRRAEFMHKQRELLAEKKKVERQKQLERFVNEAAETNLSRPMSSRAARNVLQDRSEDLTDSASQDERKKLEARKALAETLKKEVINNNKK